MILAIRTDRPDAEIRLLKEGKVVDSEIWHAHRSLASTLHNKIRYMLEGQKIGWKEVSGVIFYKGPGSFTGLRIGASVANTLAYSNGVHVASVNGESWLSDGLAALESTKSVVALPEYGGEPHTTAPRK